MLQYGMPVLFLMITAILSGAVFTPALLPFIPFRSFAAKGWIIGILTTALAIHAGGIFRPGDIFITGFSYALFPAVSSYLALNFTGATTFTNISGVKKEIKFAMPAIKASIIISFIFLVIFKIKQWGLI
jgi:acetyl-CoA decarbonylase/synthase complex subunit gamma